MSSIWSPCAECDEPLPVSAQCEGTSLKAPRATIGPLTCHFCVSECWYPGPVTLIVQAADPDHPGDAAAAEAHMAATTMVTATDAGRITTGSLAHPSGAWVETRARRARRPR